MPFVTLNVCADGREGMLWSCQLTSQCLKCCDVTIVAPIGNSFAQEITLIDQNIFGFQLFQLFTRFKYFFFANKFYDSFFFFLKIAKRVKENKRLSNFRNIACQLVTEIGQTCGIGLIVSNQRLILFCIIQMTFFKNKFAEYSVYPHKWKYLCIKCNICNEFKICFFLFSPPLYSLQAP